MEKSKTYYTKYMFLFALMLVFIIGIFTIDWAKQSSLSNSANATSVEYGQDVGSNITTTSPDAPSGQGTNIKETSADSGVFYVDENNNSSQDGTESTVGATLTTAGLSDATLLTTTATDNWTDVFKQFTSITRASDNFAVATVTNGATATTNATFVIDDVTYAIYRNFGDSGAKIQIYN